MAEVDVSNLKPNSNKYKAGKMPSEPEKEKLKPLDKKGSIVSSKKTLGRKIAESFVEEDVEDIKEYIIFDKIIPGLKNLILDALEMRFFGMASGRRTSYNNRSILGGSKFDYRGQYRGDSNRSSSRSRDRDTRDDSKSSKVDYKRIILDNREDAEELVEVLRERIKITGSASIADLFNLLGIASEYTDNDWGWEYADEINWKRISNGYLIVVPTARALYD